MDPHVLSVIQDMFNSTRGQKDNQRETTINPEDLKEPQGYPPSDGTAPHQDSVLTSGETKKGMLSCLLMSTFIGGSLLGGLVVIGLSLINPWSKPPDPVYNIVPSWGMCHVNPQRVPPPQFDFKSFAESRIQEEIDKRETILKAHLEAQFLKLMVNVKKDINISAEKSIENRISELRKDVNANTENPIKDISETLSFHLKESTENRLKDVFKEQSKLSDKMKTVEDEFQQHKQVTEDAVAEGERQWKASLKNIISDLNRTLDHFYNDTLEKFAATEEKREVVYRVIEHMNFMRADSMGLLVFLMGAMQIALYLYICCFLNHWRQRSTDSRTSDQRTIPLQTDRGDNNTLCIVYFVDRDLEQVRRWTDEIIEETRAIQRMRTTNHLIASGYDIRNIPTCRLALIFVNPDEQQLILEDEFHMGSRRRDTVQALLDKGVEVILIVYGDKTPEISVLDDGLLLDSSLTQVTSHPVLRDLNSMRRIMSVMESFSEYQKRHLVDIVDNIFA